MMTIRLYVPAIPVAQPRQRHRVRTVGGRTFAQNYTPAKSPVNEFKATIRMKAEAVFAGAPLSGPLRVDVVAVFPRPNHIRWKTKPMPRQRHVAKPDRDNIDKAILDALKGIVFADDCQACDGNVQKWIAAGDEKPHVEITITELHAGG